MGSTIATRLSGVFPARRADRDGSRLAVVQAHCDYITRIIVAIRVGADYMAMAWISILPRVVSPILIARPAMDAAELRVFEAVARLGSMNRAAAELRTVQSNITARIRLLEEELQIRLFDRRTRGVP